MEVINSSDSLRYSKIKFRIEQKFGVQINTVIVQYFIYG